MTILEFLNTISNIIIFVMVFFISVVVFELIYNISSLIKEKTKHQKIINILDANPTSAMTTIDKIDATVNLINLTNVLIDNEISKTLQACIRLKTKYEVTRLDKDVEVIATTVYQSIKPEMFLSDDLIITDNFLMQHIMDEVMLRLLKAGQEYNEALKLV